MRKRLKDCLIAAAVALVLTIPMALGALYRPDLAASDALYQTREAQDGNVVIVGIDERAFEEIGPISDWGRDIYAVAIESLNESEDCRPAAIALDVIFGGETEEELDEYLAEAAGEYGNVITACAGYIGTEMLEQGENEYSLNTFAWTDCETAYDLLREQSIPAHINVMLDTDGFLRHHLLKITLSDGTEIPSIALAAANLYREYHGQEAITLPPTDARGFWYLPYIGIPGDYDGYISLADVITGEIPAEEFAGKIVYIGPYALGLQDEYFTSIDHGQKMFGVEIHANATDALLKGEFKKEITKTVQVILLFLISFLAFLGFWRRRVRTAVPLWIGLTGGWVLLAKAAYAAGFVLHVLWIPVSVTILFVACIAINYIQEARERHKVTNTFKRYVDPSVIQELLKQGSDSINLGGQLCDIAVLFVDIRGFTTMSEVLPASEVVKILNQYLTLTTKCVMDNHGTLDKFVGDCTMAIWNAPLKQEDYVMNACKAAMAMVEGSKPLAEKLQKEFGRTVSFGVGVNVGPAVVGNIGAPMRMDYTAIGDTVNTAARLEANAPAGTVYISRAVADVLGDRIRTTSLGDSIKLKGKAEGFEVLKLEEIIQ